jgi:uncharacterized membrane protein
MESVELIPLLSRWAHIVGAVLAVGGTLFMYIALRGPLATELDSEKGPAFRDAVMNKWKHIVALAFVLVFGSGLYNYLAVTRHMHPDQPQYHMLFGIKFLLAFVAFALMFIVTSTMAWSEKLRDKPVMWHLTVLVSLAVILIAGYMKLMPTGTPTP